MEQYYYSSATGETYSAYQMQAGFGIDTENASVEILNYRGFYPVQVTYPDFDTTLYEATYTWSLVAIPGGQGAERVWAPVPFPLPRAQANATNTLKTEANAAADAEACACGFSTDLLTGVAAQLEVDRATRYQAELDEIAAIATALDSNLTAVETATTVDEINNIVNPPSGVIHIGRTGTDFDPSYYVSFNSSTLTEADTELYIPGTATVVVYGFYVPGEFDTPPDAFALGDYAIQIREVATSRVIAAFECPEGYEDIAF